MCTQWEDWVIFNVCLRAQNELELAEAHAYPDVLNSKPVLHLQGPLYLIIVHLCSEKLTTIGYTIFHTFATDLPSCDRM